MVLLSPHLTFGGLCSIFCYNMQVAYVLGQLQNKAASAALSDVLRNVNEHPMVRHEAAEALGSIAGITSSSCYLNAFSF